MALFCGRDILVKAVMIYEQELCKHSLVWWRRYALIIVVLQVISSGTAVMLSDKEGYETVDQEFYEVMESSVSHQMESFPLHISIW